MPLIVERADGRVDSRSEDARSQSGRALTSIVLRVPAAKLDGVERGWDALVSVVGSTVLLFGLLLPWLAVLAVFGTIGYLLIRLVRRNR